MDLSKGIFPRTDPLPPNSTAENTTGYGFIWPWVSAGISKDVDLDRILIRAANSLVNEHNETALIIFPVPLLMLRSVN